MIIKVCWLKSGHRSMTHLEKILIFILYKCDLFEYLTTYKMISLFIIEHPTVTCPFLGFVIVYHPMCTSYLVHFIDWVVSMRDGTVLYMLFSFSLVRG